MKIAVCSLAIGVEYKKVVHYCTETLKKYCEKQNYPLITDETYAIHDRDYMWSKIPLLRKTLSDYEYVVWIDGDMMIMNEEIRLEQFIDLYLGNKDTMMSIDCGNQINTGFWVIKNTPYMHNLLDIIENLPELAGNYHEQGVFNELHKRNLFDLQKHSRIIAEVEQRLFNATMSNYVIGDFLIHFLGIRNLTKLSQCINNHNPYTIEHEKFKAKSEWLSDKYKNIHNPRYINCKPKISIEVCTFYTGEKYADSVIKHGQKSMRQYCEKYKYPFHVQKESLVPDLPPHWTKIALLLKLAKERNCDYLVWLDADIMIMNHDISVESLIEKHMDGKDFLLSRDISNEINTGVWIVRNTDYAKSVMELILNLPELRYRNCEDQDAFNKVYVKNILQFQEHCSILPMSEQHIMNCCVGCFKWGCWLIHFFSLSKEGLEKSFNDFCPLQKDDENEGVFNHRLGWLKNYGK